MHTKHVLANSRKEMPSKNIFPLKNRIWVSIKVCFFCAIIKSQIQDNLMHTT